MKRKNQSGQALVGSAIAMVVLCGFAGLAIDMGTLRYQKRLQQTAADSGAIAGASNLEYASGVTTGAQNASGQNGFTDNNSGAGCVGGAIGCISVAVNNPPLTGAHTTATDPTNATKYVEVVVTEIQPTYFMKIFGVNSKPVVARAVATNVSGGAGCLYTLGPPNSAIEGIIINGAATLKAPTCGIDDNGDYNTKGNALVVTAGTFGVSGTRSSTGSGGSVTCTSGQSPCPTTNVPASADPLAALTPPCSPCTGGTSITIDGNGNFTGTGVTYANNTYTISPGTYTSISVSGTGGGNQVVFSPGTYIIDGAGGITIPGNATISGNGVMFYFTNGGTINETGTPVINLSPETSGAYSGILFYQDPNDTSGPTLGGNSGSSYSGALYFPKAQVTFFGNNNSISVGMVVADALGLSGSPTVTLGGSISGIALLTHPILVE
jgi:Flp pilus assembly protein TadG